MTASEIKKMCRKGAEVGLVTDNHHGIQLRIPREFGKSPFRTHPAGQPWHLVRFIRSKLTGHDDSRLPCPEDGTGQDQTGFDFTASKKGTDGTGLLLPSAGELA